MRAPRGRVSDVSGPGSAPWSVSLTVPRASRHRPRQAQLLAEAAERVARRRRHERVVVHRREGRPAAGVLERRDLEQLADRGAGAEVEVLAEQRAGQRELLGQEPGERLRHEARAGDAEGLAARRADDPVVDGQDVAIASSSVDSATAGHPPEVDRDGIARHGLEAHANDMVPTGSGGSKGGSAGARRRLRSRPDASPRPPNRRR